MNIANKLKTKLDFFYSKNVTVFLFILFSVVNLVYFISGFFMFFLNKKGNADEYYQYNLYTVTSFSLNNIFYTPSQPFIFLSSCVDYFLSKPMMSTRVVSLLLFVVLLVFFIKKIKAIQSTAIEKVYKITFFICAIAITNQMYSGTSDFLSFVFLVPPFLIILDSINLKKINLSINFCVFIGLLFAISIASRPTAIILIALFYTSMFLILGFKIIFCKENLVMLLSLGFFLSLINFLPIIQQQKIILDVKEVPEETGVNWFQKNYLMAKFWDSNKIPTSQWISTAEVIEFKKQNPNFEFPKNQIELLLKEPGLYFRQMIRMFVKAMYTSFRFMYFLFPIMLLSFINSKRISWLKTCNYKNPNGIAKNKIIVLFHFISIIVFSFIAVKMFEFRWVIPIMILYTYYAIHYISLLPIKARFLIYNFSFICGILLYMMFFIKNGLIYSS
ncbi:hypothetical protein WFZ85_05000 [Flavobacterium sp. j3]|uniref:Glycosyltransferase RgtA/B/C/D-like domain-containing protein n=1 Tax=Flavobacterium aureirubrum TaxID=3133147 RepID=A0ABU9N2W8_9FLAO